MSGEPSAEKDAGRVLRHKPEFTTDPADTYDIPPLPDAERHAGLTDHEREVLTPEYGDRRPPQVKRGYYIGFEATGVPEVDRLLAALGWAGKAYHHTEAWNDELDYDYGPLTKGSTCSDLIQRAANEVATALRTRVLPPGVSQP